MPARKSGEGRHLSVFRNESAPVLAPNIRNANHITCIIQAIRLTESMRIRYDNHALSMIPDAGTICIGSEDVAGNLTLIIDGESVTPDTSRQLEARGGMRRRVPDERGCAARRLIDLDHDITCRINAIGPAKATAGGSQVGEAENGASQLLCAGKVVRGKQKSQANAHA
jgi:hypothetical protein